MIKVLLVDDKQITLNSLRKLIQWETIGAVVVGEAKNGRDALNMALDIRPDVVISDIRMPILDGLELCRKINETMPDVVKILFTAYGDFSYAQKAFRYGVGDYILKPINKDKIEQILYKIEYLTRAKKLSGSSDTMTYISSLRERVFNVLEKRDGVLLEQLVEDEFPKVVSGTVEHYSEWCLIVYNMLLDYLSKNSLLHLASNMPRKDSLIERFSAFACSEEFKKIVKDIFKNVLNVLTLDVSAPRSSAIVAYIINYIGKNYSNPDINLASISEKLGVTPNYISNIFGQIVGESFSRYLTNIRLEKARELLKDQSIPVSDICRRVGYYDQHYFSKLFKKYQKCTPSEFRNINLKQK